VQGYESPPAKELPSSGFSDGGGSDGGSGAAKDPPLAGPIIAVS
jgi:uncharacterized membrane protein YgcG